MKQPVTLSLCVPTYRRPDCLATLLDSVARQSTTFDQVVVCDDASGDETPDVVSRYADLIPNLSYVRHELNIGLDENFRRSVAAATSDYVWFMGDDDRLRPGAVSKALNLLADHPGVCGVTLGSVDYDSRLEKLTGLRRLPPTHVVTGSAALFADYVHLLGFMSTMIVKRESWTQAETGPTGAFDNLYSQVHRTGVMLGTSGRWVMASDLVVDYRSDNDQFMAKLGGALPRLKRDVDAYSEILADLFKEDSTAAFQASDRVLRTHVIARVRNAVTVGDGLDFGKTIGYLVPIYGQHPYFWRAVVPTLLAPVWLLGPLRQLYRRFNKASGTALARSFEAEGAEVGRS